MDHLPTVAFEPTIDERVEAIVRFLRLTRAGQSLRRRALIKSSAAATITAMAVGLVLNGVWTLSAVAALTVICLPLGTGIAAMVQNIRTRDLERCARRVVVARLHDQEASTCEIQLRGEGVLVRDLDTEHTFAWHELTSVQDLGDSVELVFRSGLILARNRGFTSIEARDTFLQAARRRVVSD